MLCEEYTKLTPKEKRDFIGELVHCVQEDSELYRLGKAIIAIAYQRGLFNGVIINPTNEYKNDEQIPC
jgi:hypothetical protein